MLSLLGLSRLSMSEAVGHGRSPGASSAPPLRSRCMSRARLALLPAIELTVADSSQLLPDHRRTKYAMRYVKSNSS